MTTKSKQFLYGISMLVGMIIGVGVFGVPYAVSRAGWTMGLFYFLLVSGILLLTHFFYGEIVLRTRESHRFAGFSEKYLGKYGKAVGAIVTIASFYGTLLAYIIVGGKFTHVLLHPIFGGSDFVYQIFFFAVMALMVLIGLRFIAGVEIALSVLICLMMILIPLIALKFFNFGNFISFDRDYAFLPYGILLFALGGSSAIPEIREILKEDGKEMKKIIFWGSLIPFIITAFFAFIMVGVSGQGTSEETIRGLQGILGDWIIFVGATFGILAIATSFLVLGINLKEMFVLDLKLSKYSSWFLAVFVPFFIFLIGSPGFIRVIGITGSLFGGLAGILIVLMFLRAKKLSDRAPEFNLKIPKPILYFVILVYTLGIVYEIVYLF
jgi:tyrosine-specific transport protein